MRRLFVLLFAGFRIYCKQPSKAIGGNIMKIVEISEVAPTCHSNFKLVETAEVSPTCHNNFKLVESTEVAPTCH